MNKKIIAIMSISAVMGIIIGCGFDTAKGFSMFYIPLAILITLGMIFEKQLLVLEDKFDAWYTNWKQNKK